MAGQVDEQEITRELRKVRQSRQYRPDPLPEEIVAELLQVARWSGSSRNAQPWHFVAITDRALLRELAAVRGDAIAWVATAPLAIATVLDGENETTETFDEGRVMERLLIAAHFLGLGGGTAWYVDADQQARAKALLGIPAARTLHALVALGYPVENPIPRPGASVGRKPLAEVTSRNRYPAESAENDM